MVLTQDQRIFIVEHYFVEKLGAGEVLKLYASKSVVVPTLNSKNTSQLVNKLRQTGAVNNLPHQRTHTALTLETLATVSALLSKTPNKSLRRVAKKQKVSYGTVHHATRALQLHPYHIRVDSCDIAY